VDVCNLKLRSWKFLGIFLFVKEHLGFSSTSIHFLTNFITNRYKIQALNPLWIFLYNFPRDLLLLPSRKFHFLCPKKFICIFIFITHILIKWKFLFSCTNIRTLLNLWIDERNFNFHINFLGLYWGCMFWLRLFYVNFSLNEKIFCRKNFYLRKKSFEWSHKLKKKKWNQKGKLLSKREGLERGIMSSKGILVENLGKSIK